LVPLGKKHMSGCLYVVATPIGNLGDMTRRAVDVLAEVDTIAAEDTRRTAALLAALKLRRPRILSLRDDNEERAAHQVLRILERGGDVALVAESGPPLISDPGFKLVRLCWAQGVRLIPVPGASAVIAALSVCPLPLDRYRFSGFLPAPLAARQRALESACESAQAVVFFEAPHRMASTLEIIAKLAPKRRLMVAREMTKKFESFLVGTAAQVLEELKSRDALRGEFVCVLARSNAAKPRSLDTGRLLAALARELPPARAAKVMAEVCGGTKAEYYDQVIKAADTLTGGGFD